MTQKKQWQGVIKLFENEQNYNELVGVLEVNQQTHGLYLKPFFGATYYSEKAGIDVHINIILNQDDLDKFADGLMQLWNTDKKQVKIEVTVYEHNVKPVFIR